MTPRSRQVLGATALGLAAGFLAAALFAVHAPIPAEAALLLFVAVGGALVALVARRHRRASPAVAAAAAYLLGAALAVAAALAALHAAWGNTCNEGTYRASWTSPETYHLLPGERSGGNLLPEGSAPWPAAFDEIDVGSGGERTLWLKDNTLRLRSEWTPAVDETLAGFLPQVSSADPAAVAASLRERGAAHVPVDLARMGAFVATLPEESFTLVHGQATWSNATWTLDLQLPTRDVSGQGTVVADAAGNIVYIHRAADRAEVERDLRADLAAAGLPSPGTDLAYDERHC